MKIHSCLDNLRKTLHSCTNSQHAHGPGLNLVATLRCLLLREFTNLWTCGPYYDTIPALSSRSNFCIKSFRATLCLWALPWIGLGLLLGFATCSMSHGTSRMPVGLTLVRSSPHFWSPTSDASSLMALLCNSLSLLPRSQFHRVLPKRVCSPNPSRYRFLKVRVNMPSHHIYEVIYRNTLYL